MNSPIQELYGRVLTNIENIFDEIRSQLEWLVWILSLFKKG